jgi:hypothetical protein
VTPPDGRLPADDDLDRGGAPERHGGLRLLVGGAAVGLVAIIAITIASGKRIARSVDDGRVEAPAGAAAVARAPVVAAPPAVVPAPVGAAAPAPTKIDSEPAATTARSDRVKHKPRSAGAVGKKTARPPTTETPAQE